MRKSEVGTRRIGGRKDMVGGRIWWFASQMKMVVDGVQEKRRESKSKMEAHSKSQRHPSREENQTEQPHCSVIWNRSFRSRPLQTSSGVTLGLYSSHATSLLSYHSQPDAT